MSFLLVWTTGGTAGTLPARFRFFAESFMRPVLFALVAITTLGGCSVIAVADAAVTVAATTVKVGAKVVETTVDVAVAGVDLVIRDDEGQDEKD